MMNKLKRDFPWQRVGFILMGLGILVTSFENCGKFQTTSYDSSSGVGPMTTTPAPAPSPTPAVASGPGVQLAWSAPAGGQQTSYIVEISTDGNNYSVAQTLAGSALGTTVGGLQSGTQYYFRISAANTAGTSGWSQVVTTTAP